MLDKNGTKYDEEGPRGPPYVAHRSPYALMRSKCFHTSINLKSRSELRSAESLNLGVEARRNRSRSGESALLSSMAGRALLVHRLPSVDGGAIGCLPFEASPLACPAAPFGPLLVRPSGRWCA
jgi:hypothetical protein